MEYNTFIDELKMHILSSSKWNIQEENYLFFPEGYTSEDLEMLKFVWNTNMKYHKMESDVLIGDFIQLKFPDLDGSNLCRFSVKYLYEEFLEEGWEQIDEIVIENLKIVMDTSISQITSNLNNFDFIRERLFLRPLNYTDNELELKNCVYQLYGDIALVLYVLLYDDPKTGIGSMKVHKDIAKAWEKELSRVWEQALLNTNVLAPPRMYLTQEEADQHQYTTGAFMALNSPVRQFERSFAPVVTTTRVTNGAIAMFYPGVLQKIAEMCNGSYYIAFTSIEDARIHPENTLPPRQISQFLKNVNEMFNIPEDVLTRNVYFYNKRTGALEIIKL